MDTVKEYLRWRGISRDLNIRIRRYYEHFYKTQAVFDEKAILDGLNPALHKEIVKEICEETVRPPAIGPQTAVLSRLRRCGGYGVLSPADP